MPGMASIRAAEWETQEFWEHRIGAYLRSESFPQEALALRTAWVAEHGEQIVGFVAGHLTRRFDCDGELEWINVAREYRGARIASRLMAVMLDWFVQQNAPRVCVNVALQNATARALYAKHGAVELKPHWMVWGDVRQVRLL